MSTTSAPTIQERRLAELRSLSDAGLLKAEDVVSFASDPSTALYSAFSWDDAVAAHQHRLWQARQLIVSVRIVVNGHNKPIQAFVSLQSDRQNDEGGGYRETVAVMSDQEYRAELLRQALEELEVWQHKYEDFKELAAIFAAAETVKAPKRTASKAANKQKKHGRRTAATV